jgi:nucleoside-diphosphate-sugar epimerase
MKILILGCGGFIGNHLVRSLLKNNNNYIYGLDIDKENIKDSLENKRFIFKLGDINKKKKWIEEKIKICDTIIPLVAIATPNIYVKDPLKVFELDFESNLKIIRLVVKYRKRLIFPSTSEVYGITKERLFKEYETKLTVGPVHKSRWIYSISKQLLDRIIFAYAQKKDLKFTIFRPFNWIGPNLDNLRKAQLGNGRVISIFISNIFKKKSIQLVNKGLQKRSFTYIDDGIEALEKIIYGDANKLNLKIFNIGNPKNHITIKLLAKLLIKEFRKNYKKNIKIKNISEKKFFGKGYEDMQARQPDITEAIKRLDWKPKTNIRQAIKLIVQYYTNNENKIF